MNKGDSISFALDFLMDYEPLQRDAYSEIELQFNEEGGTRKNIKLLLSKGQITWDEDLEKYVAKLSQEETFKFPDITSYQLRILDKDTNEVYSSEIGYIRIGDVLSNMVLQ